jgi:thymidylate synthase (FAD)
MLPVKYTTEDLKARRIKVPIDDPLFNVTLISQTDKPSTLVYLGLSQDYSADQIISTELTDERCGEIAVSRLLSGKRGHWGPLEAPAITVSVGYFPTSALAQARTHRVGVSFDFQSFRYTSEKVLACGAEPYANKEKMNEVFYNRPSGDYTDRHGKKYTYTEGQRDEDLFDAWKSCQKYYGRYSTHNFSEEHLRGNVPHDYRQHALMSFNLRSAFHFLDLRAKADAQPEICTIAELLALHLSDWVPEIFRWYKENRFRKAILSP